MKEYIEKEAALEILCKNCTENCTGGTPYRCYVPCADWKLIQALTPADAEPVVHCKDCVHAEHSARNICLCERYDLVVEGVFFCADGERRE